MPCHVDPSPFLFVTKLIDKFLVKDPLCLTCYVVIFLLTFFFEDLRDVRELEVLAPRVGKHRPKGFRCAASLIGLHEELKDQR